MKGTKTMRLKATALALLLAITVTGTVFASEIYKWVDEQGQVHYGDRPTGDTTEERLSIRSQPTDPEAVKNQVQARLAAQETTAETMANESQGPSKEQLRAEAQEREQKCVTYRDRLERFTYSRHLYRENENGEREYLDEEEMQAARDQVQDQIDEYCSS